MTSSVLFISTPEIPVPPQTYGGIERLVAVIAGQLASIGHRVGMIACEGSALKQVATFRWPHRECRSLPQQIAMWQHVRRTVSQFRPDVVHSFSRAVFATGAGDSVPVLQSYGVPPHRTVRLLRSTLASRWTFTGCSDYIRRVGQQIVGGRWRRVYNCVDIDRLCFRPAVAVDAPLVFLSRIDAIKGADVAIQVAKRTGRRLVIAGNRADAGENATFFADRVAPHLSPGRVDYIGPVDDQQKSDLLGQAAALVVPVQWDEPFGLVFVEALACGTPVISCPRGALPELIANGTTGYLATSLDDLCSGVARISEIDRSACRRRAEEFSVPCITQQYRDLYHEIAN